MLNPYALIAKIIFCIIIAISLFGAGKKTGVNAQKVADQSAIDKVKDEIANQKSQASILLQKEIEKNAAATAKIEIFKSQIGENYEKNKLVTDNLNAKLAAERLRFRAEVPRSGSSSGCPTATVSDSTDITSTLELQLPEEITRNLRQLTHDADKLNDSYKACFDYVNGVNNVIPNK